jgi:hypothetical protein
MATLTIDSNAKTIQVLRPDSTNTHTISGTASNSATIANGVRVTRIISTVDCFYNITGTATTSSVYLPAGVIEYVHVFTGDNISFITSGGSGSVYVTSMV